MQWILIAVALGFAIWFAGAWYLRGADLSIFDNVGRDQPQPGRQRFSNGTAQTEEQRAVLESLRDITTAVRATPHRRQVKLLRDYMETMNAHRTYDAQFVPVHADGVEAEWVLAPGADSTRRTLYIHGGAWMMGSANSHRPITTKFSEMTGGAVLAIDYRLMPEHTRMDGIVDCRAAYRWLLDHGPDRNAPASAVFVAGDSAGGSLALALIAWVRDQGLSAPDAAVALCPSTDYTLGSPSLRNNITTDAVLGPIFGPLAWVPRSALLWVAWIRHGIRPNSPLVSPIYGDLANLPPLLLHASDQEMLLDDSVRYTNKARVAGSPVMLQTWSRMVHVWHIFHPELTEARQAFEQIEKFLASASPKP